MGTFEADRHRVRLVVDLLLYAYKAGTLGLLFKLAWEGFKMKLSWDVAMDRISGRIYDRQIKEATDRYLAGQPKPRVTVTGYDRWIAEQERERFR